MEILDGFEASYKEWQTKHPNQAKCPDQKYARMMFAKYYVEQLGLFSVSCCAFVDEVAPMAEYIKGHHYKDEYRKLMIPVVEYNELKEAAKKFDEKHCG